MNRFASNSEILREFSPILINLTNRKSIKFYLQRFLAINIILNTVKKLQLTIVAGLMGYPIWIAVSMCFLMASSEAWANQGPPTLYDANVVSVHVEKAPVRKPIAKVEVRVSAVASHLYVFFENGQGVVTLEDGTTRPLSLKETAAFFGYSEHMFVRDPLLHILTAAESWTETPRLFSITAAIEGPPTLYDANVVSVHVEKAPVRKPIAKVEVRVSAVASHLYVFFENGQGVVTLEDGTTRPLSLKETAAFFCYSEEAFIRDPALHIRIAAESWTGIQGLYNITAAVDGWLLDLIDQNAASYFNSSWNLNINQFKAWLATIAWAESGYGGYGAHSQYGGGYSGDAFDHIVVGQSFRFSTGIGPFQLDRGSSENWGLWRTDQKLNPQLAVVSSAIWHHDNRGSGSTLSGFSNNSPWVAVRPPDVSTFWSVVTGTAWSAHSGGSAALDWPAIKNQLGANAAAKSYMSYSNNVVDRGYLTWNIKSGEGLLTESGRPVIFDGNYQTLLVTARQWGGQEVCKYYYGYRTDGAYPIEVWAWDNNWDTNNRFKYVFARECNGPFPEWRSGNYAGYAALASPALILGGDTTPPTVNAFSVTPASLTLGNSFTISYTVSDTGGSGLNRVELWRANDSGGIPVGWAEIKRTTVSGNGPVSGSFSDAPSATGAYWYGMHVVDNAGNWNDEKNSNTGGLPGVYGPIKVTVTPQVTRTLTVASSNPSSGVNITVSPNDNNDQGSGTTQFTRIYNNNTTVTLTAPSTASGNNFQKWQRDGADWSTSQQSTVTMDADHTMTAVYASQGANTLATGLSNPNDLCVDQTSVYWIEYRSGTVKKVSKSGGSVITLVSGLYSPSGIAESGDYVYFAENVGSPISNIKKIAKLGGSVTVLASGQPSTSHVAVYGGNVYWTDFESGAVRKVPTGGGSVATLATVSYAAAGIAVNSSGVYWTEFNNPGPVRKVGLTGGAVTQIGDASNTPGIAADNDFVYWAESVFSNKGKINKVPAAGGGVISIASGLSTPWDVAVDASSAFWVENQATTGAVRQVSLQGGTILTLASGLSEPVAIAIDSTKVYWLERNGGSTGSGTLKCIEKGTVFPPITRILTVESSNPSSGVNITVSPNDNNGQGSGTTQFTRIYNNNTTVTLTAPSTASGNNFQKWQRNGVDYSTNQTVTVTMDANYTMMAVYVTPDIGTLTVTSPNGGESWQRGTNQNITWTTTGSVGNNLRITLWKGNAYYTTLINPIINSGSYSWKIPTTLPTGSDYRIRITSNEDDSIYDFSDAYFTITGTTHVDEGIFELYE